MPEARTIEVVRVRPYDEKEKPWDTSSIGIEQLSRVKRGGNQ
jgi:hypothetical protein